MILIPIFLEIRINPNYIIEFSCKSDILIDNKRRINAAKYFHLHRILVFNKSKFSKPSASQDGINNNAQICITKAGFTLRDNLR